VQCKLSQLQQLQQKTEMELLDVQMFSASLDNELDDEDVNGICFFSVFANYVSMVAFLLLFAIFLTACNCYLFFRVMSFFVPFYLRKIIQFSNLINVESCRKLV